MLSCGCSFLFLTQSHSEPPGQPPAALSGRTADAQGPTGLHRTHGSQHGRRPHAAAIHGKKT